MREQRAEAEMAWSPRQGAHLEAFRTHAGMRRIDLARRMRVSEETVRLWERGAVQPGAERLARLIAMMSVEAPGWSPPAEPAHAELPSIAQLLRHERTSRRLTQAAAASELGVPQATFAGWESGRSTPSPSRFPALARFLDVTRDEVEELSETPFVVDTEGRPPLGQLIGSRRQALRLTRAALAELVEVSEGTVVRWELGYRTPSSAIVPSLASALEVSTSDMVEALPRRSISRLGQLIEARQRELGLRSIDVAEQVGATEATVSRWINGHSHPGVAYLRRLAEALSIPYASVADAAGAIT